MEIIKNGLIYDGSANKPFKGDILLEGGRIAKVGGHIAAEGAHEIPADDLIVTPGFIDTHRHCDYAAIGDENFGEIELAQGLTYVCGGNCGLGISPSMALTRKAQYNYIEPCLGKVPEEVSFESFGQYLEVLSAVGSPLHIGSMIGTGAVKAAVKGYNKAPFTRKEMEQAKYLLREGLEVGAAGISMGLMYQPECYSSKEEILELLSISKRFGRPITCHIRGEGDSLLSSVREVIALAKETGLPLNISHFKATGIKNWNGLIGRAIEEIEKERSTGMDVTVDFYPYNGGSTTLLSLIPLCFMEDTVAETLKKLATGHGQKTLMEEIYKEHTGWDNMVTAIGWERIIISNVRLEEHRSLCGCNMVQAAAKMGYGEPCEAMGELLITEEGKVGVILMSMSAGDVETIAKLPYAMLISDSLYGESDCPHPRLYGAFPKFFREFVMEKRIISPEEAVAKMTGIPAKRFGISKRGMIREGYFGDLNLFRPEEFTDHATFEQPKQLSTGIAYTIIDGEII